MCILDNGAFGRSEDSKEEAIALTVAVVVYVRYKCLVILVEIEVRCFVEDDKRLVLFGNEAIGSAVIVCAELYVVASAAFQCQLVVDILTLAFL